MPVMLTAPLGHACLRLTLHTPASLWVFGGSGEMYKMRSRKARQAGVKACRCALSPTMFSTDNTSLAAKASERWTDVSMFAIDYP